MRWTRPSSSPTGLTRPSLPPSTSSYARVVHKVVAHDVSDLGKDDKAVVVRHGPVILKVALKSDGTASDGLDWAIQHVDDFGADTFIWDSDGIGLGTCSARLSDSSVPRNVRTVTIPWW